MDQFITPPYHVNFLAKHLFGEIGQIINSNEETVMIGISVK